MKEKLCEKFVKVRKISDRVMAMVLVFEEEIYKSGMCLCSPGWKIRVRERSIL